MILLAYVAWSVAVLGLGAVLVRHPVHAAFAGLIVLGVSASALNFVAPISPIVSGLVMIAGWAAFAVRGRHLLTWRNVGWFAAWMLLALAVQSQGVRHYDAGLYHLQHIRWMQESAVPLGLANLHGRFGFNSLWLAVCAMMQFPGVHSAFIAAGVLVVTVGAGSMVSRETT